MNQTDKINSYYYYCLVCRFLYLEFRKIWKEIRNKLIEKSDPNKLIILDIINGNSYIISNHDFSFIKEYFILIN